MKPPNSNIFHIYKSILSIYEAGLFNTLFKTFIIENAFSRIR